MGHWIGGDRDGNPNVGAATLRQALKRQSEVALRHYLTEIHELGAELSISVAPDGRHAEMQKLAERSPDQNAHRLDEPYRRALTGMYSRLAATLHKLTGTEALRHAVAPQDPLPQRRRVAGRLARHRGLARQPPRPGADPAAPQPADPRRAGVRLLLATLDLRQSSDQHELVVAELLSTARIEGNYSALDEDTKRALFAACAQRRPAAARHWRRLLRQDAG